MILFISTTGIIPEALMDWHKKQEVIAWLQGQPYPGEFKRRLLEGWAVSVGIRVRPREYDLVEKSGVQSIDAESPSSPR